MKKYTLHSSPSIKNSHSSVGDLNLAFDVGYSSIGWAVLQSTNGDLPNILGAGTVTFPSDDCLASKRRDFRRQRRHIRSTKRRIQRIEQLLSHLGILTSDQVAAKHQQAGGHSAPWLLSAKVLRCGKLLTWPELWDVLRWYAHNRGYDGNRRWAGTETGEQDEETEKEENAKKLMQSHGTDTMAETFCKELGVDPEGEKSASQRRFKGLNAAFPRSVVENEVRRILKVHFGKLPNLDETFERALMDDAHALPCPAFKLAKRFDGGLLFGQSVPRFDNRIISTCPVSGGKVCAKSAPEFLQYRWLMQLANVRLLRPVPALTEEERAIIHEKMQDRGAFTPVEFEKVVVEVTGCSANNLKTMLMHPDAEKALVLSPVQKLIHSDRVQFIWPHLPERIQKRARGKWRSGDSITLRQILAWCDEIGTDSTIVLQAARDSAAAKETKKKAGRSVKTAKAGQSDPLDTPLRVERLSGRAPYARHILKQAAEEVLTGLDPRRKCLTNDPIGGEHKQNDGCLVTTDSMTEAALKKPLDQLTNNHLVRHRLLVLQRLTDDIVADPAFCGGNSARIGAIAIEVNSELKEMSGKNAKAVAQDLGLRLGNFKSVVKKLEAAGIHSPSPGIIRKARVAEDLGWTCPYTGRTFDPQDLLHPDRWDKDHIIPYSDRPSNSLDSLVITAKGINLAKKNRTALQFIEEMNQGENCAERDRLGIWTPKQFKDFVDSLYPTKADVSRFEKTGWCFGHRDDFHRKRRRKQLLLLPKWEEKDAGFLPRDLTVTSHLTRLGALVLRRTLPHLQPQEIISLPGSVTGTIRTGWKLLGCLAAANPGVLDANGSVKTKTEIRDVTHMHHALDAIVIGLSHHFFPKNGKLWEAMVRREKQRSAEDNRLLLATGLYQTTQHGVLFAKEPPASLAAQIRAALAQRRVVQHIPKDMGGVRAEQNTWRVLSIQDGVATLRQRMRGPDGKKQTVKFSEEKATKLMGLTTGKLSNLKGALVIGENFGLAILDHAQEEGDRLVVIPWHKVWNRLAALKMKNGGKSPRVLRNGQIIRFKEKGVEKTWRVCSIKNTARGIMLDIALPDEISPSRAGNRVASFLKNSMEILDSSLTGRNFS